MDTKAVPRLTKPSASSMPTRGRAIKLVAVYIVFNVAWMLCFCWLMSRFVHDEAKEDVWEALNGSLTILLSSIFLAVALERYLRDLRRVAVKLEENETRLRLVGDNLPDSYLYQYSSDATGKRHFTYISAGVERVHGLTADELLNDADPLFLQRDPAQIPMLDAALAESARKLSTFRNEVRIRRQDGAARVILVQSQPRQTGDGLVWNGFVTDVTEHKKAELALEQSEERFRMLVEMAPEAIYIRTKGWFSYLNRAALRLFGSSSLDELIGQPVLDRFAPECRARAREKMVKLDEQGARMEQVEEVLLRLDGSPVNAIISAGPFFYRDRQSVLVFVRDITERKRAEMALAESERFAKATLDSLSAHIAILDESGVILAANRAWREFGDKNKGKAAAIGSGANYLAVCDAAKGEGAEAARHFAAGIRKVLSGATAEFGVEYECHSNSEKRWFYGKVTRFLGNDPRRLVVEHQDVTSRKEMENTLRQNQSLLTEMGRTAKIGGWDFDPATGEGHWTEEVAKIHDLDPAAAPTKEIGLSFFHGESRTRIESALEQATAQGTPYDLELELVSAKGVHKWVRTIGRVLSDGGRVTKLYGSFQDITERRHAEEALRSSEIKWRSYIERAPVGILVADENGRHVEANQAAEEMLGYGPDELLQTSIQDIPAPENGPTLGLHFEQLAARGKANGLFLMRRKDGGRIWVLVHASKMADGRLLGIFQNITEQKKAAEALRESEEQFRAMFETASIGVIQTEPATGGIVRANRKMCGITGYSVGELLQMKVKDLVHPEDWPGDAELRQSLIRGESSDYHMDKRYLRKDGKLVWVSVNMTLIRDAAGQPVRTVATVEDITERRKAVEEWLRLSTALEQAAESIVITDLKGIVLYVNPAFEKISGYSRQEMVGHRPGLLKSGKHDAAFYQNLWATLERGEVWRGHFINRRKDGRLYEEEATISPVRNSSGKIDHYMAIKLDVTREVALESQFRQAQKLEAIGQLAGGVAHDFNNLLTSILMQVELGELDTHLGPETREGFKQIRDDANRAASLTRQLLLFSRRQVMQSQDLDLNEVVTNLAKMLQRIIGEDIHLQLNLHSTPLLTHADAGMLDQVAMNLAVNARDAMPDGGRVVIETTEFEADEAIVAAHADARVGRYVCLAVSDTGTGIPPEVLPRIFEPFFTTKEAGKGTGLGLATVFGIVKQHEGWLVVTSELGKGTTFKIFLPALAGKAATSGPAAPPQLRGGSETILLAEDDEVVRSSIRRILSRFGYHVLEAANGADAVNVWSQHHADVSLLLTDLVMPGGMNGQQLARRLRADEAKLKIVYSSGYSAEIAGQEIRLGTGERFIQKPLRFQTLLETVRNCLDE